MVASLSGYGVFPRPTPCIRHRDWRPTRRKPCWRRSRGRGKSDAYDVFIGPAGFPQAIEILLRRGGGVAHDLLRVLHHQHFFFLQAGIMEILHNGFQLFCGEGILAEHRSVSEHAVRAAHFHGSGEGRQLVVAQTHVLPDGADQAPPAIIGLRYQAKHAGVVLETNPSSFRSSS